MPPKRVEFLTLTSISEGIALSQYLEGAFRSLVLVPSGNSTRIVGLMYES